MRSMVERGDLATSPDATVLPSASAASPHRILWLLTAGLVAAATFAVFGRAASFEFLLWDDDIQITDNPTLRDLGWATAWRMFTHGYAIRYQPLSWLSSALIARLGGLDPIWFHTYNIVLHAISAVLLAAIIRWVVLRAGFARTSALLSLAPAFGALVWALHPLRVEAVVWATGWRYCQSVVLMLASALCYLRAVERQPEGAMRTPVYWLSVFSFLLSALSYPFCLEWPLVLVVLDVYPLRRWHARGAKLEKLPFAAIASLVLAISIAIRVTTTVASYRPGTLVEYGIAARIMKGFVVWANAILRTCFPFGLHPVYVDLASFQAVSVRAIASAVALVGMTLLLVRIRRAYPMLLALWLVHLALLGAKLGILEAVYVDADRYTYPAGVAWAAIATSGFLALGRARWGRIVRMPLALTLLAILSVTSVRQTALWRNSTTFFQASLPALGNTGFRDDMLWRLALAHWRDGDLPRALPLLDEAVARRPDNLRVRLMRTGLLQQLGRAQDARQEMSEALRLTHAETPDEAVRKISEFVRLPSGKVP